MESGGMIFRAFGAQCWASAGLVPVEPRLAATWKHLPFPLSSLGRSPNGGGGRLMIIGACSCQLLLPPG